MGLQAVLERLAGDRGGERAVAFARHLWTRFLDDRCFETAGALSYTTVFALVPLTAVSIGVLSAFPVFEVWSTALIEFVFSNFVPEAAHTIEAYLLDFAAGAGGLTLAGLVALLVAAALTLSGIETTFNRLWRVPQQRPPLTRLLVYWTLLTLGTLFVAAGLGFTSYFIATAVQPGVEEAGLGERMLRLVPGVLVVIAFTLAFRLIPNRRVPIRHAIAGALFATLLFELVRAGLALYLRNVPTYQQLYGTLAAIPVFLLWVYLSWLAVLLGASFAASLSGFRFQPASLRLPEGFELYGMLRLLGRFRHAQLRGESLDLEELHVLEPILSEEQLQVMIRDLAELRVVRADEEGCWFLARDLDHLPLAELYDAAGLRVPIGEAVLPCHDDALGKRARAGLDELRVPLRQALKKPVGQLIAEAE